MPYTEGPPGSDAEGRGPFLARATTWSLLEEAAPRYLSVARELEESASSAKALDAKTRAFVRLTLNAAVTHLHPDGVEQAMAEALAAGATSEEILEVLVISCTVGVHGMNTGLLAEVLAERGFGSEQAELSIEQGRLKAEYRATRGYWREFLEPMLRLAPDFFRAYLHFSAEPWVGGQLDPKTRELIYLAFDTSPTHLHLTGLRVHIENALDHGATTEEIVEVMAHAALLGLQTLDVALPLWHTMTGAPQPD